MKKIISAVLSVALLLSVVGVVSAKVEHVNGPWELTAPQPIDFICGGSHWYHHLNTVSNNDPSEGKFLGTGVWDGSSTYLWDINGTINGDTINFTIVYSGGNPGYTLNGEGIIASNGSISGTVDNNCKTFSMGAGSAVASFEGNHGQWVKMSNDKQEAAQSRIGMPVQSEGHTE